MGCTTHHAVMMMMVEEEEGEGGRRLGRRGVGCERVCQVCVCVCLDSSSNRT